MAAKKRNREQDKKRVINIIFHIDPPVLIVLILTYFIRSITG
jgi:hypothetical protein